VPYETERGRIRSAGAVVWRPAESGHEIALVHRPRYDDWSYPKGKREPGEHVLVTAVREVAEETGLRVVLGRPLSPTVYPVAAGIKEVSYWVARSAGASLATPFVPNNEVDEVAWLPADKARGKLSYERDAAVLDEFGSGPVTTAPLILLRHAEAGRKPERTGPDGAAADLARPLDARGVAEADLLAALLASYGKCRVISSEAERCVASVRPYAAAVGVPVETEPAFTVAPGQAPAAAGATRAAALALSGQPALICGHRENLPGLIHAAFGAFGASPPDAVPLRKGEFLVLQSAGGALVSAERHDLES
jgi:8-oxo-(d)GTP phosphatase